MIKQTDVRKGVVIALLTALISGVSIFYSKAAVVRIDPLLLTATRNLLVGILFSFLVLATGKHRELWSLSSRNVFKLFLIGLIGGTIPFYLFFSGLQVIGAQQANIIHKSLFVWVAIFSFIFLKEKIDMKLMLAGLLILIGSYFFTPLKVVMGQGVLMILVADLFWAGETLLAKKVLQSVSFELVGLSRMVLGGSVLFVITVLSGKASMLFSLHTPQIAMIGIGAVLLFFYVYTWFKALALAPATVVTLVLTGSTVFGAMLNGAFAQVRFIPADWYSMLFTGAGICISVLTVMSLRRNPAPEKISDIK